MKKKGETKAKTKKVRGRRLRGAKPVPGDRGLRINVTLAALNIQESARALGLHDHHEDIVMPRVSPRLLGVIED